MDFGWTIQCGSGLDESFVGSPDHAVPTLHEFHTAPVLGRIFRNSKAYAFQISTSLDSLCACPIKTCKGDSYMSELSHPLWPKVYNEQVSGEPGNYGAGFLGLRPGP